MTAYDFAGLVGGLAGAWMAIAAGLIGTAASLRLAAVRGRPGKGRLARAALAFALVVGLAGIALFLASEYAPFRRALDRAAPWVVAGAGAAGLLAGWRAARRRPAPPSAGSDVAAPPPGPGPA